MPDWFNSALPSICWAVVLVVFLVSEGLTVGITSIWFAAGALCALIVSAFTDNLIIQVMVFLVVSLAALVLLRPFARKHLEKKQVATNADRAIGAEAVVTEEINNLKGQGAASVAGVLWTARAEGDAIISAGETVKVLRIEGVKLIVTPVREACAAARV